MTAGLLSLIVSPIGLALVVVLVERRAFVVADQYMAYLIGDALLAVAVGIGFALSGDRPLWSWWLLIPMALGAAFGWWQSHEEVAAGVYTLSQAHSPSKLYHQFVCYPVLGALLSRAAQFAWGRWPAMAVIVLLVGVWWSLNIWDRANPKDPHVDYRWSGPAPSARQP